DNDGFLALYEIYPLPLADCELAVLSACQTNVGPQHPLEAGVTLASGFLAAGGRRGVASHWRVRRRPAAGLEGGVFGGVPTAVRPARGRAAGAAEGAAARARAGADRGAVPLGAVRADRRAGEVIGRARLLPSRRPPARQEPRPPRGDGSDGDNLLTSCAACAI